MSNFTKYLFQWEGKADVQELNISDIIKVLEIVPCMKKQYDATLGDTPKEACLKAAKFFGDISKEAKKLAATFDDK